MLTTLPVIHHQPMSVMLKLQVAAAAVYVVVSTIERSVSLELCSTIFFRSADLSVFDTTIPMRLAISAQCLPKRNYSVVPYVLLQYSGRHCGERLLWCATEKSQKKNSKFSVILSLFLGPALDYYVS